jgi:hypothetical protein
MPVALACNRTPFSDTWNWGGSSIWEESGGNCHLQTQVTAIDAPAAASVSYLRRQPTAPLRLRFTVDAPDLPALNALQSVSMARGVVRRADASSSSVTPAFDLILLGNLSASKYYLGLSGWCASEASNSCSAITPAFTAADFPLEITLDAEVGAGASGRLGLWMNSDPDMAAPTLQLANLDNAAIGGIDRVLLGLFATRPAFNQVAAGHTVSFRGIETSDEQLFWSDFESLLAGNVEANRPPLTSLGVHSGTTCGSSALLPQVAHGTTTLYGPVAIHPVSLSGPYAGFALQNAGPSPLMMFLCPAGAGPSGACFAAGRSNGIPLAVNALPPGDYQLVVGAAQPDSCGDYLVSWNGPFDD